MELNDLCHFEVFLESRGNVIRLWDRACEVIHLPRGDGKTDKISMDLAGVHGLLNVFSALGHRFSALTDIDEAVLGVWILRRPECPHFEERR